AFGFRVLGETATTNTRVIPALRVLLDDQSEQVREMGAEAISWMRKSAENDPEIISALLRRMENGGSGEKYWCAQALENMPVAVARHRDAMAYVGRMMSNQGIDGIPNDLEGLLREWASRRLHLVPTDARSWQFRTIDELSFIG